MAELRLDGGVGGGVVSVGKVWGVKVGRLLVLWWWTQCETIYLRRCEPAPLNHI